MWPRIVVSITSVATLVLGNDSDEATHYTKSHLRSIPQPRIIGGYETDPARYPFSVSLQTFQHFCGGTLIAPDVVLTAAHCSLLDFSEVIVVIGSHTVDGQVPMGQAIEEIPARRVYAHPEYNSFSNAMDFALVFLQQPATANVAYVRLNTDMAAPSPGDTLTALGWGDTTPEDGYDFSNTLLEVDVNYIENDVCDASTDGVDKYKNMIFDDMMCASGPGKDGCQGDSGECIRIFKLYVLNLKALTNNSPQQEVQSYLRAPILPRIFK